MINDFVDKYLERVHNVLILFIAPLNSNAKRNRIDTLCEVISTNDFDYTLII